MTHTRRRGPAEVAPPASDGSASGADLLAARLARRAAQPGGRSIPAHSGTSAPLTATQEGMWYEAQIDPGWPRHHRPTVVRWRGRVDATRLRDALADLVARHATLTTTYPLIGRHPRQQPPQAPDAAAGARRGRPGELVDLVLVDGGHDPRAGDRAVAQAATWAFDLSHASPLAATLVSSAPDDHLLVLALSHLAVDGPSAELLVTDLVQAYAGRPAGEDLGPSPASDHGARTSFADWAAWQRDRVSAEAREDQLEWWSRLLAHRRVPERLALGPLDPPDGSSAEPDAEPAPGATGVSGRRVGTVRLAEDGREMGWVAVPAEVADALRSLARVESVTMHAVTLAAYQALWWSRAEVGDLVVGVAVGDRDHADLESVVGCFVRILPVRLRAAPADTGRDLVRRTSAVTQAVLDHRDVALPEITAAVGARQPDGVAADLLDAHFQYRRQSGGAVRMGDVALELETVVGSDAGPSVLILDDGQELSVAATTAGGGVVGGRQLAEHLVVALGDLVRSPDRPLRPGPHDPAPSAVHQMTAAEVGSDGGTELTLVDLFEQTVAAHGTRPAARHLDQVLTYAELDRRARAVATRLEALGVRTGDPVVLALDRSVEWVVAMLGVVLAGGVYVPIDPSAPAGRTAAMVADVAPAAVIHPGGIDRADADADAGVGPGAERVAGWSAVGPHAPVYVLFTSGSTGRPKGVAVTHANVVQLVQDPGYLPMVADDVVVFSANPTFDGTTIEVWGALAAGACLVVFDPDTLVDPPRLEAALRQWGVTVMGITVAWFQAVARQRPGAFASLRVAAFGGEACEPRWVRAVVAAGPPARLMHDYGPTETTCAVAYHDVDETPAPGAVVPMGRSLDRATLHVLDPGGRGVEVGLPGELYIGGPGVALGYVHRPELTADRFVADPFSSRPGARLYRSGDMVVQRPDGVFEFLGRMDTQLKIRGFRVETGEIEAALADHPDVDLAAVRTWSLDRSGEPSLVAYVVLRPDHAGGDAELTHELSAHLATRLPPYMHPRMVVRLDSMPLTGNGKVDRRALPEPVLPGQSGELHTSHTGPPGGGDGLATMVGLWRSVLETDWIDPDDHFFDVGGHSLRAMALLAAVRDEFRVDLRVADLVSADTPRALARLVADRDLATSPDGLIELHPCSAPTDPVLFIPPGVAIHYLTDYRRLAQHLELDRPALTFEVPGMAPGTAPRSSVPSLVRWYRRLIERHQPTGPLRLVGHSLGATLALEVARDARRAGRDVAALVMLDPRLPRRPASGRRRARILAAATAGQVRAATPWGRRADHRPDQDLRQAAGHALARYRPSGYDGAVTMAVATGLADQGPGGRGGQTILARWTPLLSDLSVIEVSGLHMGPESIVGERYVADTAAAIRSTLA